MASEFDSGTIEYGEFDFFIGVFVGLLYNLVGIMLLLYFKYSKLARIGAIIGCFIINIHNILFYYKEIN